MASASLPKQSGTDARRPVSSNENRSRGQRSSGRGGARERNAYHSRNQPIASNLNPAAESFQFPHPGVPFHNQGMNYNDLVFFNNPDDGSQNYPYYSEGYYHPHGYYDTYDPCNGGPRSYDTTTTSYYQGGYRQNQQNYPPPAPGLHAGNTNVKQTNGYRQNGQYRQDNARDGRRNPQKNALAEFPKTEQNDGAVQQSMEFTSRENGNRNSQRGSRQPHVGTESVKKSRERDFYKPTSAKDGKKTASTSDTKPEKHLDMYKNLNERDSSSKKDSKSHLLGTAESYGKEIRSAKERQKKAESKSKSQSLGTSESYAKEIKMSKERQKKVESKSKDVNFIKNGKVVKNEEIETQRGRLIEDLMNNTYECMVCCDVIRREVAVWHCSECYHVYHLFCIKKWARSPSALVDGTDGGWRCPACQNVSLKVPNQYRCFCSKQREPQFSHYETPHSCGEVCGKNRRGHCNHACNILCHPGPCPTCNASVTKKCNCEKVTQTVKCCQAAVVKCENKCSKMLNCGKHDCQGICHPGSCEPCEVNVEQMCHCSKSTRSVLCGSKDSFVSHYACNDICEKTLQCGNHQCKKQCHDGDCERCELSPDATDHCPCGKTLLSDISSSTRRVCTDPIPICQEICDKELICGPENKRHRCNLGCHEGSCKVCSDGITPISCRCEATVKEVSCEDAEPYLNGEMLICTRRCTKKRQCGKHKCQQPCCIDKLHACSQICGRKLQCGLHRCEDPCHRGYCQNCWNVCFEEITCHCGSSILDPPIPCGTKPPECHQLCRRDHPCQHTVRHNCHSEEKCPPCTELTKKMCHGQHELRHNIPCHIAEVSCGLQCRKALPCRQHKCTKICHKDDCLPEDNVCQQACQRVREWCEHICGTACHVSKPCPETSCKAKMQVKCVCGNRSGVVICGAGKSDAPGKIYQQMTSSAMAGKILYLGNGQTIDINSINAQKKTRQLDCDEQCAKIERNRRVALALQIENPDLSDKLGAPNYDQFLRDFARANPNFVADIEKALADLVQTAKTSKYPNRSHSFKPMKREQRRLIHELAEFYGCKTQSYDYEPIKSVVATAYKDKCWMPNMTLTVAIRRATQQSAPLPIPHNSTEKEIRAKSAASRQSTNSFNSTESDSTKTKNVTKSKFIDYFDFDEES